MKKLILMLLITFFQKESYACDCDSIIGEKEASIIFKGTVFAIKRIDSDFVRYEITFRVSKAIKGYFRKKKVVIGVSCLMEMCCGIPFNEGDAYVIYAFIRNGILYTSACTKSKKIQQRKKADSVADNMYGSRSS